jgi:hypothetical protein
LTALAPTTNPSTRPRQPVYGNFRFYPGTVCRVFLNDLPVFQGYEGNGFSHNGRVSHYLVPGENRLALEVLSAPPPRGGRLAYEPDPRPQMGERDLNQTVEIAIFKESTSQPGEVEVIHQWMFPDLWKDVPEERRRVPYMHVATFDPGVKLDELAFLRATPQEVPCEGTPALHEALRELHAAFVARDADKLAELMQLQIAEFSQTYRGSGGSSRGDQLGAIAELVNEEIVVEDLDWTQLHFHARAGGRVVHVERLDRAPVLGVKTAGKPQGHASDPVFTFHEGRWRLM